MCGIVGVLTPEPRPESLYATVQRMAQTLRHRGPDGEGVWVDPKAQLGLGHTRLSVLDLEGGAQPMGVETCQIVFNGEIYNHETLRDQLSDRGHHFRTRSDTEVILRGYQEWGEGVVDRLDGMFAFGLWDQEREVLVLARDRTGKKPLYWSRVGGHFSFASEIKALRVGGAVGKLAAKAFPLYLTYGYVPGPETFYEGVYQLPPATIATVGTNLIPACRRYWSLEFESEPVSEAEAISQVRRRLTEAVELRMVADVPVGAFLSGGLDSSIVVGLMSQISTVPVRTFSIGFGDDPTYDETHFARQASDHFGTDHTEFKVEAESVDLLDNLVEAYDQPFGDSSAIPTYIVSRLTKQEVTVALTGDGGDELFAGYLRLWWGAQAERLPRSVSRVGQSVARMLPWSSNPRSFSRRATRFLDACALPMDQRMLRWIGQFGSDLPELLRPEVLGELRDDSDELMSSFRIPLNRRPSASPLNRLLQLNFETYLPEDLLVKTDRCSMAHGLELRSPFLDPSLMAYAARLPDGLRVKSGRMKWILGEAFRDMIPPSILSRSKMGFGVPLPSWFRTHWRPLLEERILSEDNSLWQWLNPEPVRRLADEHLSGSADHGHRLWTLLTLERWLSLHGKPVSGDVDA